MPKKAKIFKNHTFLFVIENKNTLNVFLESFGINYNESNYITNRIYNNKFCILYVFVLSFQISIFSQIGEVGVYSHRA